MKRFSHFILLAVLTAMTVACGSQAARLDDYRVSVYTPEYASGFEIVSAPGLQSTILKTKSPWQGAENTETLLFIARDGEPAPAGFNGQTVKAGARRIVCMSSTYVAMLGALGQPDRVVGVSGRDYISNEYVSAHPDSVADLGFDGNINYELLLAQKPDLVLLFGVTGASGMESKLRELGIPFCYIGEYLEESPLGKAEWLVAVAEIIDCRTKGQEVFASIPERYEALKTLAATTVEKPKIMINTPYGDSWFMASTESYVARLIADAGGEYIYKKNTSNRSLPVDLEEAYLLATNADLWINLGSFSSLADFKARLPKFAEVPCVRANALYNCDKRLNSAGGNDYWESGVVHPDLVLLDLIKIFHPRLLSDREFTYYRQLE